MKLHRNKIKTFQKKILRRYDTHKRILPWRDTNNPYRVLVSEVMSQQTQVERVVPKFLHFIDTLPSIQDLAKVQKPLLLSLRSGLWFNSRALRLQQAAIVICEEYNWRIPNDRWILLGLPGIWPYTSASICAFAYNLAEPVVDTNIRRVLISELHVDDKISTLDLEHIARQCIPDDMSNDRHNALMDYGSLVATAKSTGIKPTSKQSKFKWSDREVRWWIIKQLVGWKSLSVDATQTHFPDKTIKSIVSWMTKDWLIRENKWILTIDG